MISANLPKHRRRLGVERMFSAISPGLAWLAGLAVVPSACRHMPIEDISTLVGNEYDKDERLPVAFIRFACGVAPPPPEARTPAQQRVPPQGRRAVEEY